MNILLLVAAWTDHVFFEVVFVHDGKSFKHGPHLVLGAFRDPPGNRQKRFVRFEFRPQRQVSANGLPLMELAYLHRNILENAWYSGTAVKYDRDQLVPLLLKVETRKAVLQLRLVPQFVHVKVLALDRIARHQHAVLTAEKRDVHDGDNFPRPVYLLGNDDRIEPLGNRSRGHANIISKLRLRALAVCKFVPEILRLAAEPSFTAR